MMRSEDDDLLSYTPLKRLKVGYGEFLKSSQLSYSQVQERNRNKIKSQISRNQSRSQCTQNSSKNQISNTSKTTRNQSRLKCTQNSSKTQTSNSKLSTSKKKSPLNSFKKSLITPKEDKNSVNNTITNKAILNNNSSVVNPKSSNSLSKSKSNNIPNELNAFRKLNNNIENKLKITNITNIFEDITPDIDLTQAIETASCYLSDEVTQAFSINDPKESELINLNIADSSFNSTDHVSHSDDTGKDFLNVEDPVQTDFTRVNSWLESSVDQGIITPSKVKYITSNLPSESLYNENQEQEKNQNSKTCVHLHFHVNSPKRFIQPTLDYYFKKSSCNLTPNENDTVSRESKDSVHNQEDVMKTWKNIMNSKKSNKPGSSKTTQGKERVNTKVNEPEEKNALSRKCPFYKFVEDTSFVVDGFSYGHLNGVTAYFLSHFHADHYKGLSKKFQKTIYCSQITANLVRLKLNVGAHYIRPLPMEEPRIIDGVEVTLYDSNHCPGAVMFLFKLITGKTLLHVGDFRANPNMETISAFWNNSINVLYLDTTYLDPSYDFLSQSEILEKCRSIANEHFNFNKQTLFLVGSYTIGKEKVFKAIASELDSKIYAPPWKERILRCLDDKEITNRLTKNKHEARVHVVPMSEISPWKIKQYMEGLQNSFKVIVAIKPTGWEHSASIDETLQDLKPKQIGNIYIYGLPYSEHSSYFELQRFVQFVQSQKIIPTVNVGNVERRNKMMRILQKWQDKSKRTFLKKYN